MQFNPSLIDLLGESPQSLGLSWKTLTWFTKLLVSFRSDDDNVVVGQWKLLYGAKRLRQAEKRWRLASLEAEKAAAALEAAESRPEGAPKALIDLADETESRRDDLLEVEDEIRDEVDAISESLQDSIVALGGHWCQYQIGPKLPLRKPWQDQLGWWNGHGVAGA